MNRVCLVGRMGTDADLSYTPSGVAVGNFRLAVTRPFKKDGESVTDWFQVVLWRQSAEFAANYLGKGRLVSVEGRLQAREYTTQDGQKRNVVEVVADDIRGLDRPKEDAAAPAPAQKQQGPSAADTYEEGDPFAE